MEEIRVKAGDVNLGGHLTLSKSDRALVVFVHGSGSSRFSPRNQYVASVLNAGGLGTLLFDLLTAEENELDMRTRELRFDIGLLSERIIATLDWISESEALGKLPLGLFGSSTGAAAALNAAAARPQQVLAVVSRGGRPDLAMQALPQVLAPTLLLVGGLDFQVIALNSKARAAMSAPCKLEIIEGATHLFEEPGKLELVATRARDWFCAHTADAAHAVPLSRGAPHDEAT